MSTFHLCRGTTVLALSLCCVLTVVGQAVAEERPYVGINPDFAAQVKGMQVKGVTKNGPADKAGVKASDVIIKVDTNEIQNLREFLAAMRFIKIGKNIKVVVKRKDKEMTLTIVPESRPANLGPGIPQGKRPPTQVAADGTVTFGHTAEVLGIVIFPDGKRVVSASWREDYIWELATGKELGQFIGARSLAVAISGDGKRVAIEGFDALTIHDAANNKQLLSFNPHGDWDRKFPFRPQIFAMTFSADNKLLATTGREARVGGRHGYPGGVVNVWDAATGKEVCSFGKLPHTAGSVAFSPDGKQIAAGTFGASSELPDAALFSVWEIGSGKQILSAKMHEKISVTDNPCNVRAVIFHPDGKHVLTGSLDNKLRVWELSSGKLTETRAMNRRRGAGIAAFSPDAKLLAFGGVRVVSIHEVATGKEIKSFPFDVPRIRSLTFSRDGKWLVAGGGDSFRSGAAKAWKVTD
ncbi:MAG: PDZ domain-containing protein [Planctomycetota bacterium]|nr:PDZ domain-containing protein [Planctomycetota bacterium]